MPRDKDAKSRGHKGHPKVEYSGSRPREIVLVKKQGGRYKTKKSRIQINLQVTKLLYRDDTALIQSDAHNPNMLPV